VKLRLLVVAAALALGAPAAASAPAPEARAFLVQDARTGAILLERNDRERVPIASITKLMTVLLTMERAKLDDVVTVSPAAAAVGESSINLAPGERMTVRDLLEGALIQSANDAADALAAYVGGGSISRFVELMNERARQLGLTDTHFVRPDGLDAPGHVSSARDVTRLARIVMRIPFVRETVRERVATISGGRTLHTWNDLLSTDPGVVGVKTGHTSQAGWSQVAALRGPYGLVYATILGSPSRTQRNADLAQLLAWGADRFRAVAAVRRGRVYAWAAAPYGRKPVALVAPARIVRIVRLGRMLTERVVAPRTVSLPVAPGERLGEVRVYAGRRLVARSPLVARAAVARPGLGGRLEWYGGQAVHHAWSCVS
jgi:serine-type D-Ala-D-Ala carboxypeptidase (penicillin-binding protein 5/6)